MTPDIDQIRQYLADAKPLYNETMVMSDSLADAIDRLYANAPVWLASLCAEIERLRAESIKADMRQKGDRDMEGILRGEIERLRTVTDSLHRDMQSQLAAALAECERLRARLREEMGVES